jgi:hypothetical protein
MYFQNSKMAERKEEQPVYQFSTRTDEEGNVVAIKVNEIEFVIGAVYTLDFVFGYSDPLQWRFLNVDDVTGVVLNGEIIDDSDELDPLSLGCFDVYEFYRMR